jgi:dihydrolipoamide dehydrogenase
VIGAGSAGLSAYRAARKQGAITVLIESGPGGTTCARHACMPSKLLIAAANATYETRLLDGFGVQLPAAPRVDGQRVMQRVRAERDRFVASVLDEVAHYPASDTFSGQARFLDDHRLRVSSPTGQEQTIVARAIVIATGASAHIAEAYQALGDVLATSDDVFEWPDLPRTLAIVGTGVIAVELGQALSRLGVAVTLFGQGGGIAGITDPDVAKLAWQRLGEEFTIHPNADVRARRLDDGRAEMSFADESGQPQQPVFDRVLIATGRRPNVAALSLENTSVECDAHGVPSFDPDTMQCGAAPIFIAGDANAQRPWLNDAANEGRIAGEGAVNWPNAKPQRRPTVLSIVFSDPGIIRVGQSFDSLPAGRCVIGAVSFANQGRSRVTQRNFGLLRVYADVDTGHLLGAEGILPAGEHLAHLLAWSIEQRLTLQQILTMPFYHPVFEEGLRTAIRDAEKAQRARHPCVEPSLSDAVGA